MRQMFQGCKSLIKVNIDNLHISKITNFKDIFKGCDLLKSENVITQDEKIKNEVDKFKIF